MFPGKSTRIHQSFEDPPSETALDYGSRLKIFRRVRDEIRDWLNLFISQYKG